MSEGPHLTTKERKRLKLVTRVRRFDREFLPWFKGKQREWLNLHPVPLPGWDANIYTDAVERHKGRWNSFILPLLTQWWSEKGYEAFPTGSSWGSIFDIRSPIETDK